MNYTKQMNKVIQYIGQHFDEDLTLEALCKVACFSKYHFHRIFTSYTGLSLQKYIRWLRLKRAAHQLISENDKTILEIAIDAGFESHQAFTRVFKQECGVTPSRFRNDGVTHMWSQPPFCLPDKEKMTIDVVIQKKQAIRLAVIEHRGPPENLAQSVQKIIAWSKAQTIDLKPKAGNTFGFGYDDPKSTPPEKFRFDVAKAIPEKLNIDGDIIEKYLPAGRYAVAIHNGSRDSIGDTVYAMYREWLPESGEELADLPCIFCYQNFEHKVAVTELVTECWLLLK